MQILEDKFVPPPEPPTCGNCKFQLHGTCSRYPPVAFEMDTRNSYGDLIKETVWAQPVVYLSNRCGEHKL